MNNPFIAALDGEFIHCAITEIVLGRQPACADQTPNQGEYSFRGSPRGTCPPTHGACGPCAISTSDAITHTEHRKTVHVYNAHGRTSLARAIRGRVGTRHSRLGERCMDQRATRSTDMRRDMALGCGSVLPIVVFLHVNVMGRVRRTTGGEHARRSAPGRSPIAPITRS